MGCDGGTIPKRDELVRKKKKEEKVTKEDSRNTKWKHCAMSQAPLEKPIVACELGRIFNKETIIKFLIKRKSSPEAVDAMFVYIKSLKDIRDLKLTPNPAYTDEVGRAGQSQKTAEFICPITGLEMSGNHRFVFLWKCGCVFSERGLKEVKDGVCMECSQTYTENDIIPVNPEDEEIEGLEKKMEERRSCNGKVQKNKRKRPQAESTDIATTSHDQDEPSSKTIKTDTVPTNITKPPTNTPSTSCGEGPSRSSTASHSKNNNKDKKHSSIQNDPNASETYKSIFNTHPKAKNQAKAHWVTCNPLYY